MDVLHRAKRKDDKNFLIKATLAGKKRVFAIFKFGELM